MKAKQGRGSDAEEIKEILMGMTKEERWLALRKVAIMNQKEKKFKSTKLYYKKRRALTKKVG